MQDALLMRVVDRLSHRLDDLCPPLKLGTRNFELGTRFGTPFCQTSPFHIIHREVLLAFVFANFVNRHDVGMLQSGRRLGFGAEALHVCGAGQLAGKDHFDGNGAVEADLPGFINHAHAAAGDLLQQFVIAEIAKRRIADCGLSTLRSRRSPRFCLLRDLLRRTGGLRIQLRTPKSASRPRPSVGISTT